MLVECFASAGTGGKILGLRKTGLRWAQIGQGEKKKLDWVAVPANTRAVSEMACGEGGGGAPENQWHRQYVGTQDEPG